MGRFLGLPNGELSKLADLQRTEDLRKKGVEPPQPLFPACRELLLRKCEPGSQKEIRRIFEKEPFGELERLVTQKVLDVAQRTCPGGAEEIDVFSISPAVCKSLLDPSIESWDIDLRTFCVEITSNPRLSDGGLKRFEFVEREAHPFYAVEPGLEEFLKDAALSGDASEEEIEFLKSLRFRDKRPTLIFYYRELQNFRDPLHFRN